jgi:hypothetical protein
MINKVKAKTRMDSPDYGNVNCGNPVNSARISHSIVFYWGQLSAKESAKEKQKIRSNKNLK